MGLGGAREMKVYQQYAAPASTTQCDEVACSRNLQRSGVDKCQICLRASPVAQMVKNPPAVWETWVPSLGWEDPLEKGMATHSSILA